MLTVNAYAAPSATEDLVPTTIQRRDVGPYDVLIDIKFAGICHSDIHTVRGDWGPQSYPLAPGHEIAGIVTEVGSAVTKHAVGDRVGVGCMVNSCGECANCQAGEEQYCLKGNTGTYGAVDRDGTITQGGYSTRVVVTEEFVVSIPDGIELDVAAPLLCAGITTYSPLNHFEVEEGDVVGVVGLGGLGHMAVKIAKAKGAQVTVFTTSERKFAAARELGADRVVLSTDPSAMEDADRTIDVIIDTVAASHDLNPYFRTLRVDGALFQLGLASEAMPPVNPGSLIRRRLAYAGSLIGGIAETQEMLDFCAEHGVVSDVEVVRADQLNEAFDRMVAGDVKYRFVLDASTLGSPAEKADV